MKRLAGLFILVVMFGALAAMRATSPSYLRITGPIAIAGTPGQTVDTGNLVIRTGPLHLAQTLQFKVNGKQESRDSGGFWLVVPVQSQADRNTARVNGAVWETTDGRQYTASSRVIQANAVLSPTKTLQPGLQRHDLLVFELPSGAPPGGVLLLSEEKYPRLAAQARIRYPATPLPLPAPMLDLDEMNATF